MDLIITKWVTCYRDIIPYGKLAGNLYSILVIHIYSFDKSKIIGFSPEFKLGI